MQVGKKRGTEGAHGQISIFSTRLHPHVYCVYVCTLSECVYNFLQSHISSSSLTFDQRKDYYSDIKIGKVFFCCRQLAKFIILILIDNRSLVVGRYVLVGGRNCFYSCLGTPIHRIRKYLGEYGLRLL